MRRSVLPTRSSTRTADGCRRWRKSTLDDAVDDAVDAVDGAVDTDSSCYYLQNATVPQSWLYDDCRWSC